MKQLIALISVVLLSMLNQVSFARKINDHNQEKKTENTRYHFGQSSPDGIGKFYMGREISHVMGHLAAGWLERPEREQEERVSLLVEALNLKAGDKIADIGAGTGYIARQIAVLIGSKGIVYGVDVQPEMVKLLTDNMKQYHITNVKGILGKIDDPNLPINSIDLAIMVDVYHEFSHPYEMIRSICKSLKPGGRLVFVEYRLEDPSVPIKRLHKMSELQVLKEASPHPLEWVETIHTLPRQHIIIFKRVR
ncbi:methyltransferase type 11 [Candidatus Poribacteria bacterium]|nr:methyltransferase type 11 [Candidatus Poribacteria bacterium]